MIDNEVHNAFHQSFLNTMKSNTFERSKTIQAVIELGEGTTEYGVKKIVDQRTRRGQNQYLVKWTGYANNENTWLPAKT